MTVKPLNSQTWVDGYGATNVNNSQDSDKWPTNNWSTPHERGDIAKLIENFKKEDCDISEARMTGAQNKKLLRLAATPRLNIKEQK